MSIVIMNKYIYQFQARLPACVFSIGNMHMYIIKNNRKEYFCPTLSYDRTGTYNDHDFKLMWTIGRRSGSVTNIIQNSTHWR